MVTKIFSIFISSLILVQSFNIQLNDILKLNELIEHAQFHKSKYGDGIFTFFSKHYGELKENHNKNHQEEDHKQLPFGHNSSFDTLTAFVLHKVIFKIEGSKQIIFKSSIFFYQEMYSFFEKVEIFQPPQFT